jgi:nitrous oxidase accessory protein
VTTFAAPGFALTDSVVRGFLDGVYVERSDAVSVLGNTFVGAGRYSLHVMFSRDTLLQGNTVRGGNVGSAAMYGRGIEVRDNLFEGHVGPLAFGLLLQELEEALVVGNTFVGNTVALLVVSAPGVRVEGNIIGASGFGMLVQRARTGPVSAVTVEGNRFFGNVSDIAVDDPEAAMRVHGNQFEGATRLDMDGDGVSDVPHMPSSTYDMLASRQPDLSLFALSPGIILWQTAEATVPALRLATLQDDAPDLRAVGLWSGAPGTAESGTATEVARSAAWLAVGLVVLAVLIGTAAGRVRTSLT